MTQRISRRSFVQLTTAAALLPAVGCRSVPRLRHSTGRMQHACVGVGGMGAADLDRIRSHPDVDVVAMCDVDAKHLAAAAEKVPGATLYADWREMFANEAGRIDSVSVSTPDHMHASPTVAALENGQHVYCQKPLTHNVVEARRVAAVARRSGVVTQMGIQNHSGVPLRQAFRMLRSGIVGRVREVHVWSDRPAGWWPQGVWRPEETDPVPEHLDWDLWLGVAPERPYKGELYHPFAWRGWVDFGTGAQGDMACHLMDPAFWYLELGSPTRVWSSGPAPNGETYPEWTTVHYEYPATPWTVDEGIRFTWYDGGRQVPEDVLAKLGAPEVGKNACLFVAEDGALYAGPYEAPRLFPEERFAGEPLPEVPERDHWHQWVEACFGREEASAPFEYAAHLTECALLGNVALEFPREELRWDASDLRFPDRAEANRHLRREYRDGWRVSGLG